MPKTTSPKTAKQVPVRDRLGSSRPQNAPAAAPQSTPEAGAEGADASAAKPAGPRGKIGALVARMRAPGGATIPDLMETTGWQAHSVRGAIAGAIKKKLGLAVTSTKTEAGRVYRIEAPGDAG